jgi:hypothetical protein
LIDLDREGLGEYKYLFSKNNNNSFTSNRSLKTTRLADSSPTSTTENSSAFITSTTAATQFTNNTSNGTSTANSVSNQITKTISTATDSNPMSSLATELSSAVTSLTNEALDELIFEIFSAIDTGNTGKIELIEAQKTLLRLNSCLDKKMEQREIENLFKKYFIVGKDSDMVSFPAFRMAFLNISI